MWERDVLSSIVSSPEIVSARDDSNRGYNPPRSGVLVDLRLMANWRTTFPITLTVPIAGISAVWLRSFVNNTCRADFPEIVR